MALVRITVFTLISAAALFRVFTPQVRCLFESWTRQRIDINYGIIIFRIKLTDLQSLDFDHGRGTYLFYPKCCAYSRAALNQRQRLFE